MSFRKAPQDQPQDEDARREEDLQYAIGQSLEQLDEQCVILVCLLIMLAANSNQDTLAAQRIILRRWHSATFSRTCSIL